MTKKLSIALLLCLCHIYGTAQLCNTNNILALQNYPSVNDSGTYILKVRVWSPGGGDCNWGGCFLEPALCKVTSSSDPRLTGRFIRILFTERMFSLATSQTYIVVMQPTEKSKIWNWDGSWQRDTCIKKVYLAKTAIKSMEHNYRPLIKVMNTSFLH